MKIGYKILDIYEIFHFPESNNDLFREYISVFFKLKVEGSGPPKKNMTKEELIKYTTDIKNKHNIEVDVGNIRYNPGLRSIAKLALNSLWGKLAMNKKRKTVFVKSWNEFQKMLNNPTLSVVSWDIFDENTIRVQYDMIKDFFQEGKFDWIDKEYKMYDKQAESPLNNVVVASFVTSYARLHLYQTIKIIDQKLVIYCDTDSIIYCSSRDEIDQVKYGDGLGDFKDEIEEDDKIIEVVAGGSKQYSYRTEKGTTQIKLRGIQWNASAEKKIQFSTLQHLVKTQCKNPELSIREEPSISVNYPTTFVRDSTNYLITSKPQSKKYKVIFNKRVIVPGFYSSYPIGFSNICSCCCCSVDE